MSKIKDDKKHILETLGRDQSFADDIKKISTVSFRKLAFYINSFVLAKSVDDYISSPVLNYLPDKDDRDKLAGLIDETGQLDDEELQNMVSNAGKQFKNSNANYLLAIVTVVVSGMAQKVLDKAYKYDAAEMVAEVNHISGESGDLKDYASLKGTKKSYTPLNKYVDDDYGAFSSYNYKNTAGLISNLYADIKDGIKKNQPVKEFMAMFQLGQLSEMKVSTGDVKTASKTKINRGLAGAFDKFDAATMNAYRTLSARIDSNFKLTMAEDYGVTKAIIINETEPCKYCLSRIGKVYSVDNACSYVPRHPSCRCEVKLLENSINDEDDEDLTDDDE